MDEWSRVGEGLEQGWRRGGEVLEKEESRVGEGRNTYAKISYLSDR